MKAITDRGMTLMSVTDGIDSSTAAGRMMIEMLGSLAEYERELTKECTALKRAASPETSVCGYPYSSTAVNVMSLSASANP